MVIESDPDIIDPIPKTLYFLPGYGQFLDNRMLKLMFFKINKLLQQIDFLLIILDKAHDEGFDMKMLNQGLKLDKRQT